MRAIIALLWLAVLGMSVHNWWQIRELKRELVVQREAVRISERSAGLLQQMEVALERGQRARQLIDRGKYDQAGKELDAALTVVSDAAQQTDATATQRLRRVEETLSRVRDQAQGLLRRVTPGSEKRPEGG